MTENVKHVETFGALLRDMTLHPTTRAAYEAAISALQREAAGDGEGMTFAFMAEVCDAAVQAMQSNGLATRTARLQEVRDQLRTYTAPRPTGTDFKRAYARAVAMMESATPASAEPGEADPVPWRCPHCINRGIKPCPHSCENWRKEVADARGGGEAAALERWSVIADGTGGVEEFKNVSGRWVKYNDVKHLSHPTPAALDAEDGKLVRELKVGHELLSWNRANGVPIKIGMEYEVAAKVLEIAARATTGANGNG
jgi:hypothetical protein